MPSAPLPPYLSSFATHQVFWSPDRHAPSWKRVAGGHSPTDATIRLFLLSLLVSIAPGIQLSLQLLYSHVRPFQGIFCGLTPAWVSPSWTHSSSWRLICRIWSTEAVIQPWQALLSSWEVYIWPRQSFYEPLDSIYFPLSNPFHASVSKN